jgi:hypothetical protein
MSESRTASALTTNVHRVGDTPGRVPGLARGLGLRGRCAGGLRDLRVLRDIADDELPSHRLGERCPEPVEGQLDRPQSEPGAGFPTLMRPSVSIQLTNSSTSFSVRLCRALRQGAAPTL